MKAITLWQPWASLMALGVKQIETRTWETEHRGPLAIHSARALPAKYLGRSRFAPEFEEECARVFHIRTVQLAEYINLLPRGKVLCTVDLISIEQTVHVVDIGAAERLFGNYEEGRYAWHTSMLEVFKPPIPALGNRMLWEWGQQ